MNIPRMDGSGAADPDNPHPDKKVPALVHDGVLVTESAAIFAYLTDLFPHAGIAPVVGDEKRGPYLSWLAYYAGVIEPVVSFETAGAGWERGDRADVSGSNGDESTRSRRAGVQPVLAGRRLHGGGSIGGEPRSVGARDAAPWRSRRCVPAALRGAPGARASGQARCSVLVFVGPGGPQRGALGRRVNGVAQAQRGVPK